MILLGLLLLIQTPVFQNRSPEKRPGPHLLFLDTAGRTSNVDPAGLALDDPRERDVWRIEPQGFPVPDARGVSGPAIRLELANGDVLQGRVDRGKGEALSVDLVPGVRLSVGIDHIRSLRIAAGGADAQAGGPSRRLEPPRTGDRLFRRTSGGAEERSLDAIDGTIESFEGAGVRFDSQALGVRTHAWREVAALFVEVLELGNKETAGDRAPVVLDLRGGSRLRGALGTLTPSGCTLQAVVAAEELTIPWNAIHELVVDDGSHVFLSELAAKEEVGRGAPFGDDVGMLWNHRPDRSVYMGKPLTSGGRVYRRGIGTHAPTRVVWDLPEGMTFLRGKVGIDDSVLSNRPSARGSVVFRVFLDGEVVWESPILTGGSPVISLPSIELGAARELALEADPVENFQGDRADWLDMLLVR